MLGVRSSNIIENMQGISHRCEWRLILVLDHVYDAPSAAGSARMSAGLHWWRRRKGGLVGWRLFRARSAIALLISTLERRHVVLSRTEGERRHDMHRGIGRGVFKAHMPKLNYDMVMEGM